MTLAGKFLWVTGVLLVFVVAMWLRFGFLPGPMTWRKGLLQFTLFLLAVGIGYWLIFDVSYTIGR